ncbi:MAG: hypothetical protein OEU32_08770 [Acidimicrobiia bacterium]|nr:hypothetical protein [Acidimicrobiia bacterium]
MAIRRAADHWVWSGGPVPPGSDGITLGSLVIVKTDHTRRLLRHERVHVEQWRRLGVSLFLWRYVTSYLRWRWRGYPHKGAYRRIPLEVEAYWRERVDHDPDPDNLAAFVTGIE